MTRSPGPAAAPPTGDHGEPQAEPERPRRDRRAQRALLIFFQGGHFLVFYYVFILPVLMGVRFFRDRSAYRNRQQAAAVQTPSPAYGQAGRGGYGQPGRHR